MTYGSVCSGIEAATVAWEPLGFRSAWFAEIDPFCSALLAHHYPDVENLGDFTRIDGGFGAIDILAGGTPCQSFSVAGRRGGLDDARGNLAIEFCRLAGRLRPRWVVWENVPGVLSSNGGRDFGSILGALADLGYGCAWRVLDAQFFGVPQRRRRVFVVGHLGDWRRAAAVLLERQGLCRDTPARRKATSRASGAAEVGPSGGRFTDIVPTLDARCKDGPVRNQIGLIAFGGNNTPGRPIVTHALRGDGFDASEDGTGRGTPIIPMDHVADAMPHDASYPKGFQPNGSLIRHRMAVRRLTPRECERLQGFPDDYTLIPYRGKLAADGPRYRAIGNSMAVPVMRWIGRRIQIVDAIRAKEGLK